MAEDKDTLIRKMSNLVLGRYRAQAKEIDKRFDERIERIDQNLEKSKRSQEAIDKWLNRPRPQ